MDDERRMELKERAEKFRHIAANAREVVDLAGHPLVKEFFDRAEAKYTQEMITAAPGDDDTRRGAACMLKAVQDLRAMMSTGEAVAEKAEEEYVRLANETDEG